MCAHQMSPARHDAFFSVADNLGPDRGSPSRQALFEHVVGIRVGRVPLEEVVHVTVRIRFRRHRLCNVLHCAAVVVLEVNVLFEVAVARSKYRGDM